MTTINQEDKVNYQTIFRSSPDLYLIVTPSFHIVDVSDAYLQATMVARDAILGRHVFDIFPSNRNDPNEDGLSHLRASFERVLKNKMPDVIAVQRYDIRRPESEGGGFEERYWSLVNSPVLNENNEVNLIIHRVKDVTDYVKAVKFKNEQSKVTEKLLTRTDEMEIEIYRRAQEIQEINNQLQAVIRSSEEANQGKSEFLAAMSHEIRTPLNGVIGMTNMLLDTVLTSAQKEYIDIIRISGEILLSVINDVLDFSKIESGNVELENLEFNLHTLIEDAVETIAASVYKKNIAIGTRIDSNVPMKVMGDSTRIRQILNNLLGNAAKFTEKGEISINAHVVKTRKEDRIYANKTLVLFEVNDTGIGVIPEVREKLFKPFSQGDISTTRKYGGTGLGLIISKRLVEMMGGVIDLESIPGVGSKFWFTLPFEIVSAEVNRTDVSFQNELQGVRVLCVDDNEINRKIIRYQLESWKMTCDTAASADEALLMLSESLKKNRPYELVISDYLMPGKNGIDFVKSMRMIEQFAQAPVIILSSFGVVFDVEKISQLGVAFYLTKPVRKSKLLDCLLSALQIKENPELNQENHLLESHAVKLKAEKILLVEDNEINQKVALSILKKIGYEAEVVSNGREAIQAVEKNTYHLILMDCQMPEMDGYTAAVKIRELEKTQNRHTPIIAMTAYALKGDREKCLKTGMDDYITKPIDINKLKEKLNDWLSQTKILAD